MDNKQEEHSSGSRSDGAHSTCPARPNYVEPAPTQRSHHAPTSPDTLARPFQTADRGPLIEYATNKWQDEKAQNPDTPDEESSCPTATRNLLHSRRFRRMLAGLLILLTGLYYLWARYLHPRLQAEHLLSLGFQPQSNGTYGLARGGGGGGTYPGLTQIQDLDPSLLPGGPSDPDARRRLVFIGDVHGCRAELEHLLSELSFSPSTDHLILTGDVVSKGPDSAGVLDLLRAHGASSVRGNHEDRLLVAADAMSLSPSSPSPSSDDDDDDDDDSALHSAPATSFGAHKDRKLLRHLKPRHLRYLRSMPLILRIPALPLAAAAAEKRGKGEHVLKHGILVVHAGLVPGVPLERQDPYYVMNMRSIHAKSHVPSTEHAGKKGRKWREGMVPWAELWGWYNERVFKGRSVEDFGGWFGRDEGEVAGSGDGGEMAGGSWWGRWWGQLGEGSGKKGPRPWVTVYGHDSRSGLNLKKWSKGLDSGCVKGKRLTAMVVDARGRQEIVHVKCKDYLK